MAIRTDICVNVTLYSQTVGRVCDQGCGFLLNMQTVGSHAVVLVIVAVAVAVTTTVHGCDNDCAYSWSL